MNNRVKFAVNQSEEGYAIELEVRCRLGSAPKILRALLESTIEPLARELDPPSSTPPDESI